MAFAPATGVAGYDACGAQGTFAHCDANLLREGGQRTIVDPEHSRSSGRFYGSRGRDRRNRSISRPDRNSRTSPSPSPMAASGHMTPGRGTVTLAVGGPSKAFPAPPASLRNHRPARTNPIPPTSPAIATTVLNARIMDARSIADLRGPAGPGQQLAIL